MDQVFLQNTTKESITKYWDSKEFVIEPKKVFPVERGIALTWIKQEDFLAKKNNTPKGSLKIKELNDVEVKEKEEEKPKVEKVEKKVEKK